LSELEKQLNCNKLFQNLYHLPEGSYDARDFERDERSAATKTKYHSLKDDELGDEKVIGDESIASALDGNDEKVYSKAIAENDIAASFSTSEIGETDSNGEEIAEMKGIATDEITTTTSESTRGLGELKAEDGRELEGELHSVVVEKKLDIPFNFEGFRSNGAPLYDRVTCVAIPQFYGDHLQYPKCVFDTLNENELNESASAIHQWKNVWLIRCSFFL
jgi:hypothetical protein